jgi:putative peptide zinc metalloprotease protein
MESSNSRPIALRKRGDLTARKHIYQGEVYWIIKEPVGLNYFRFPNDSYFVLQLLDGKRNLEEIEAAYNEEFSPRKLTIDKLQSFVGSLHKAGLVQAAAAGQGRELLKRRKKTRRQKLFSAFGNVLALRFRGIDPDRILNALIPWTWWLFTRPALLLVLAAAATALMSIFVNWDLFLSRLPTFNQFFDPVSWGFLAVVLAVVKILHEFGHGLSCKRFGGECHEMGFMLLVLTPCLYCNVSDSWTLPSKWHRAAIGAAGIYVELILATIATFLWWNTGPGLINQLCLQMMTVCSISTILFNGNPLLRFDGYYILSDLMEIPNLQQKSSAALTDILKKRVLGIENTQTQMMPTRNKPLFAAYAIASVVYRWFIVIAILTFLNRVFEPWGLQVIGQMIAVMSIGTMIGMPAWKLYKFFKNPGMRYQIRMRRTLLIGGIAAAVTALGLAIPFPYYVHCEFTVRSRDSVNVYVLTPGEVQSVLVQPWTKVREGDTIVQLENLQAEQQLEEIESRLREKEAELAVLKMYSLRGDASAVSGLAMAESEIRSLRELELKSRIRIDRLLLRAPCDGTVLPVVESNQKEEADRSPLQAPLAVFEPLNAHAWLPVGLPVCTVGNPEALEAVMAIPEERVAFVRKGLAIELKASAFAGDTIESTIGAVGRQAINPPEPRQPSPTSRMGRIAAAAIPSASNQYFATADLGNASGLGLKVGSKGRARIRAGNRSLWSRFTRWAADTFRFQ